MTFPQSCDIVHRYNSCPCFNILSHAYCKRNNHSAPGVDIFTGYYPPGCTLFFIIMVFFRPSLSSVFLKDTVWENQSHSDSDGGQFCPNLGIIAIFVWKMKSKNILGPFKKFHILWDIENTYFYDITGQFSTYFHHAIDYFTASGTFSRRKVQY